LEREERIIIGMVVMSLTGRRWMEEADMGVKEIDLPAAFD
jgi:hypothetical protein